MEASRRVEADTTDNLIKMAIHIVKQANQDRLIAEYSKLSGTTIDADDLEGGNIEERIPEAKAKELLSAWKKILIEYAAEGNSLDALFAGSAGLIHEVTSPDLESLKDKLFIATGEDQIDTWEAFAHYNLSTRLSADDRKNYA